jgi:hypothetical protein
MTNRIATAIWCSFQYTHFESMENIARALGVEMKDLFEFAHLQEGG